MDVANMPVNRIQQEVTCLVKQAGTTKSYFDALPICFYCTCLRYQISKLLDKQERNLPKKSNVSPSEDLDRGAKLNKKKQTPTRIALLETFMCLNKYMNFFFLRHPASKNSVPYKIYVNKSKFRAWASFFFGWIQVECLTTNKVV